MSNEEAIKNLMEMQLVLQKGNDEESLAYNKRMLDTIKYVIDLLNIKC